MCLCDEVALHLQLVHYGVERGQLVGAQLKLTFYVIGDVFAEFLALSGQVFVVVECDGVDSGDHVDSSVSLRRIYVLYLDDK